MSKWVYFYARLKAYITRYKAVTPFGYPLLTLCVLFLAEREATAFLIIYSNTCPEMPRTESIGVKSNNSKLISWATVARIYNALPCEVCKCETIEDAKGYTKALLYLLSALFIAGLEKGGAL